MLDRRGGFRIELEERVYPAKITFGEPFSMIERFYRG